MDGIKIEVTGNIARVLEKPKRITAGTVGLPVEFTFDSQWDGLSKTAVFMAGCMQRADPNLVDMTTVSWEVLRRPGFLLHIGVYGANADGTTAIPTTWVNVGTIYPGAYPGLDPTIKPTPNVWLKVLNSVGDLTKLATTAKDNLVNAINELHGKFVAHSEAKTNPHNVTAEQVGAVTKTLLWENESVTSEFPSNFIIIDSFCDYDGFEIVYYDTCQSTAPVLYSSGYMPNVLAQPYKLIANYLGSGSAIRHRNIDFRQYTGGAGVRFDIGYYRGIEAMGDGTESNESIIPYQIYGIKGVSK